MSPQVKKVIIPVAGLGTRMLPATFEGRDHYASVEEAPSDLAVVGRYVFSSNLWPLLKITPPGAGDEIQLTDAMAMLLEQEQVNAYYMKGKSHDCGNKVGYVKAFIEYAKRHPETRNEQ